MSTILVVVGENLRKKALSCDHQNSLGLESGEYGDKFRILAPVAWINGSITANLWAGRLSITMTAPYQAGGRMWLHNQCFNVRIQVKKDLSVKSW